MIYVFEDDERDIISLFFKKAYPESISRKFVYARGCGNFETLIDTIISENPNEYIMLYIDMPYGNENVVRVYNKLARKSRSNGNRLIIMPVVCMEYYLVKSLCNSQVIKDRRGIDICINKEHYVDSPIINTQTDRNFVKNFEKYCKLILIKNLMECAAHGGKTTVARYGYYYEKGCLCELPDKQCTPENLVDKAVRFLSEFPCVPSGSYSKVHVDVGISDLWGMHKRLVSEYNELSEKIKNVDIANRNKYKQIRPVV